MAAVGRSLGRLVSNRSFIFVCDMQEKFRPSIRYFPEIITVTQRMVRVYRCYACVCMFTPACRSEGCLPVGQACVACVFISHSVCGSPHPAVYACT